MLWHDSARARTLTLTCQQHYTRVVHWRQLLHLLVQPHLLLLMLRIPRCHARCEQEQCDINSRCCRPQMLLHALLLRVVPQRS
jgi:hypothetical protein